MCFIRKKRWNLEFDVGWSTEEHAIPESRSESPPAKPEASIVSRSKRQFEWMRLLEYQYNTVGSVEGSSPSVANRVPATAVCGIEHPCQPLLCPVEMRTNNYGTVKRCQSPGKAGGFSWIIKPRYRRVPAT
jgi:hypothetical protein